MAVKTRRKVAAAPERGFVSVIYFHGMGSQRRYEETSRLIDSIDNYLTGTATAPDRPHGRIRGIQPKSEPARGSQTGVVTYISTLFSGKDFATERKEVRFYEVYWAPVMAGSTSAWSVAKWMFAQVGRPWRTLRTPWRERQRLRRSSLIELMENRANSPAYIETGDFATLLRSYDDFEGPDALREYPQGSFADFLSFVRDDAADDPQAVEHLERLARTWHHAYVRRELANALALATIALALLLTAAATVFTILWVLQLFAGFEFLARPTNPFFAWLSDQVKPNLATAIGFAVSIATFLGLSRFLVDYMGDVESWATYEETNEKHKRREEVLFRGIDLFSHVLADDRCERAVIVSHSLGTTIAHDTLLAVARGNRARNAQDPISGPIDLRKVRHFVTIASPVDKVEYFFESYASHHHRYKRVVEALRGDIGDVPFVRNRKPYVHWVNFWDRGDVISGPLHSPANSRSLANRVDNVHVANFSFPDPAGSHSAYFRNATVIGRLFEMIYLGGHAFQTGRPSTRRPPDYEAVYLGPGSGQTAGTAYFALLLAVPWLALVGATMAAIGFESLAFWIFATAGAICLLVLLGRLAGCRQREPI